MEATFRQMLARLSRHGFGFGLVVFRYAVSRRWQWVEEAYVLSVSAVEQALGMHPAVLARIGVMAGNALTYKSVRSQLDAPMADVRQLSAQVGIWPMSSLMDCAWTRAARMARRVALDICILPHCERVAFTGSKNPLGTTSISGGR